EAAELVAKGDLLGGEAKFQGALLRQCRPSWRSGSRPARFLMAVGYRPRKGKAPDANSRECAYRAASMAARGPRAHHAGFRTCLCAPAIFPAAGVRDEGIAGDRPFGQY
ncbi:hypothetical protein, partial [Pseudoroseomonas ludipueritiae]|uniref:hypothetical protein n=1 Tax=Pseudoroseomonas ludipueritiae TaxID=198093 RepID=UPI001EEF657E